MLFMAQNLDRLVITRPVRGLIQFGLDSNHGDRQRIQAQDPKIARDFAVLEERTQPRFLGSLFMVIAGLGLTLLLIAGAAAKTGYQARRHPARPASRHPRQAQNCRFELIRAEILARRSEGSHSTAPRRRRWPRIWSLPKVFSLRRNQGFLNRYGRNPATS